MTQLADDCFAFGGELMRMEEALAVLLERLVPITDSEEIALAEARGRILAEDLVSAIDVPAQDNAAVDGYAFRSDDLAPTGDSRFPVVGRAAAGHPLTTPLAAGAAARIFTGGAMPEGADTVVMQEDVRREGDEVIVPPGLKQGANRRLAGEDTRAGMRVLAAGRRLRAQDIGFAASVGRGRLLVRTRLKVAVFSSGDELAEPGGDLPPGGVFDANRYILMSLLGGLGCEVTDVAILPDRLDAVRDGLARAAEDHQLLVTSGGVSTGEEDHIKAAIEALGKLHFWRLAIKPGRPLAVGQIGAVPFIGLPGNPVATMVCFLRFARVMVLRLAGANDAELAPTFYRVRAGFDHKKKQGRREWVRARLTIDADGMPLAHAYPTQGSGVLRSMVESDGLVEFDEATTAVKAGDMVPFLPFSEVLG